MWLLSGGSCPPLAHHTKFLTQKLKKGTPPLCFSLHPLNPFWRLLYREAITPIFSLHMFSGLFAKFG
ncbi:hypothetical protein HHE06_14030 [Helicobacter heilmannii]|nr:hypothetical protein HHE06_14030 [Helicobacter heilmannii]